MRPAAFGCSHSWPSTRLSAPEQLPHGLVSLTRLLAGQAGAPGAVIGATLAGAMHLVSAKVDAVGGLQQLLISLDLLDPPPAAQRQQQAEQVAAAGAAADVQPSPPTPRPWWHNYLPVRKVGRS